MQYDCGSVAGMEVPNICDPTSLEYGVHIHHLTVQPVTTMDLSVHVPNCHSIITVF